MAGQFFHRGNGCGRPGPRHRPPLILVNGLAEQADTWRENGPYWRRHFDVHMPELLTYDGPALRGLIAGGVPVTVEHLAGRLHDYLEELVQTPPYFLVANSLGGKVAVTYAATYPGRVAGLVLLCPSGLSDGERLPALAGLRPRDVRGLVESVFFDRRHARPEVVEYYRARFGDRTWRRGLLHTIRGTVGRRVDHLLPRIPQPTLVVSGREDAIVPAEAAAAAARALPRGRFVLLPRCGHAPQIEHAPFVNRLVVEFLIRSPLGVSGLGWSPGFSRRCFPNRLKPGLQPGPASINRTVN